MIVIVAFNISIENERTMTMKTANDKWYDLFVLNINEHDLEEIKKFMHEKDYDNDDEDLVWDFVAVELAANAEFECDVIDVLHDIIVLQNAWSQRFVLGIDFRLNGEFGHSKKSLANVLNSRLKMNIEIKEV